MSRTIATLALIKVQSDHLKKDYLEIFIPFVATLIRRKNYESISTGTNGINMLCRDFREEYGLVIPFQPMLTLLNRARKRNIIKKELNAFKPVHDNVIKYDFTDISREVESKQIHVIDSFIRYCESNYQEAISREEAETTFICILKAFDKDILFASEARSALPEVKELQKYKFLFCSYLKYVYSSEPDVFKFINDLALGHILASALLYAMEFKLLEGKFGNIKFYFDSPFIFRLLGVEGHERKSVCTEFIEMLNKSGSEYFIFEHVLDEVMSIIDGARTWIDRQDYDPSKASTALRYFVERGYTKSDIERFSINVRNVLQESKIAVLPSTGIPFDSLHQLNESRLKECILDVYRSHSRYFDEFDKQFTIDRDVKSISFIYTLRKGILPRSIKESGHIFVTTNSSLAIANRRFELAEYGDNFYIPLCVTDVFLGTIIWLQYPLKVESINQRKFIADCYASLQPDILMIKKYIAEIEKLEKDGTVRPDECYLLRSSLVARELLMEKAKGDPDNITDKTPLEILEEIKSDIKRDASGKYNKEVIAHTKTKEELELVKAEKESIRNSLSSKVDHITNILLTLLRIFLFFICIATVAAQFYPQLVENIFLRLFFIILTLALLYFGVYGLTYLHYREVIRNKIRTILYNWIADRDNL